MSFLNTSRQRASFGLVLFAVALVLAPWIVGHAGGNTWVRTLDFALLYIMLALGLNIVVGYAGLLDMGFIAFYAVGAYLAALLSSPHLMQQFPALLALLPAGMHTSIWLILPLAALLAAGFGVLLGAPTLRLRGDYLAIVTLGFGEIIRILLRNLDRPVNITNGPKGISQVDPINLLGINLGRTQELFGLRLPSVYLYYYLFAALVVLILFACIRLERSRIGRAWVASGEELEQASPQPGPLWSVPIWKAPPTLPSSVCLHHRPASSLSSQPPWCGGKNPSFRIRKKKTKNQKPELKFWFYPGCDFGQVIYLTSWCLSSVGMHITLPLTPWSMGRIRADD